MTKTRTLHFQKIESDTWISRPIAGREYKIIRRWLKGYVLYLDGHCLESDSKLNLLKRAAQAHLNSVAE
jgi:hypothetical protein